MYKGADRSDIGRLDRQDLLYRDKIVVNVLKQRERRGVMRAP